MQLRSEHARVLCRRSWRRPCTRRPWCWSARTGRPGGLTPRMWSTSCSSTSPEIPQSMCGAPGGSPGAQAAQGWCPSWFSAARCAAQQPVLCNRLTCISSCEMYRARPVPQRHSPYNFMVWFDEFPGGVSGCTSRRPAKRFVHLNTSWMVMQVSVAKQILERNKKGLPIHNVPVAIA